MVDAKPRLVLVRHGRPRRVPDRPAAEWELDPAHEVDVHALRERLPGDAVWYSSAEPKAVRTAALLTGREVAVESDLGEHRRGPAWVEDFDGTVRAAFAAPDVAAYDGWEPLSQCRARVVSAVRRLRARHPDEDLVLVGHGTAWTLVVAELRGEPPDLDRWARLAMPDLLRP